MGIATGMMGLGLTVLGIVLGYMWKSNGKIQAQLQEGQLRLQAGQKEIAQIVKDVAQMVQEHGKILERIEARTPSPV